MLQSIRDRTSGLVAGFIVALLVVPFAFWGVQSFTGGGGDPVVAKVGSEKIKESQFRRAYEQRYQQYLQLMGENFRADQFDQGKFQQSVLDDMTQESLLRQQADKLGYRANDAILFNAISAIPAFQSDGKFNTEQYRAMLARQNMTPQRFESQLRQSLEIDQMREAITDTAFMPPVERQQLMEVAGQQREISYALLDIARYAEKATVSDDAVKQRYEDTKSQYMAPERIKLAYVELSQDTLPAAAAPDQDVLKVLYDAEKGSRFTSAEQRKVSHILINFGPDKSVAKKKAEAIEAKLKAGADFAALAKSDSDDVGSKAKGGDLGWLKRGDMPSSFEKAAWSLGTGETSGPVETEFGWHLIHIDQIKPSSVKPFTDAEVQQQLTELYRTREKQKQFEEASNKLEQLAFENPTSLEPVAKALGLKVRTTDWFTRAGGSDLAANDAVKEAAFSPEVLKDGENSKPLAVGDSRLVVIRKDQYEAPRQRTFDEVADQVRRAMREEQGRTEAQADAKAMLASLEAGKPLAEVAAALGAEVKDVGALRRDDTTQDSALVEAAFKLPHPTGDKPRFGEARLSNGDVAVLVLSKIHPPPPEAMPRDPGQFNQLAAGMEYEAYRSRLAEQIKVKIVNAPQAQEAAAPDE
jgi:peptidyl-prolyl cis-trans isomerase D